MPRRDLRPSASAAAWELRCASNADRAGFYLIYRMAGLVPGLLFFGYGFGGDVVMARVALVTGGTCGIGAAIAKALKAGGYKVAANYGGNDEAAQKFKTETGIPVFKWDVSSYDACVAGLKQVEADLGPVEVLVNNAGITRDTMFHRMTPEQWNAVINTKDRKSTRLNSSHV